MDRQHGGGLTQSRLVVILGVAGIALALVSFAGPWWEVRDTSYSHLGPSTMDSEFAAFGFTTGVGYVLPWAGTNATLTSNYQRTPAIGAVLLAGMVDVVIGLSLEAVMVVAAAMAKARRRRRAWDTWHGVAPGVMTIAGLAFITVLLPVAVAHDLPGMVRYVAMPGYWGSGQWSMLDYGKTVLWGGGWGWYAALGAAVLFLAAAFVRVRAERPSGRVPASPSERALDACDMQKEAANVNPRFLRKIG